jgi:hypothetical protein
MIKVLRIRSNGTQRLWIFWSVGTSRTRSARGSNASGVSGKRRSIEPLRLRWRGTFRHLRGAFRGSQMFGWPRSLANDSRP